MNLDGGTREHWGNSGPRASRKSFHRRKRSRAPSPSQECAVSPNSGHGRSNTDTPPVVSDQFQPEVERHSASPRKLDVVCSNKKRQKCRDMAATACIDEIRQKHNQALEVTPPFIQMLQERCMTRRYYDEDSTSVDLDNDLSSCIPPLTFSDSETEIDDESPRNDTRGDEAASPVSFTEGLCTESPGFSNEWFDNDWLSVTPPAPRRKSHTTGWLSAVLNNNEQGVARGLGKLDDGIAIVNTEIYTEWISWGDPATDGVQIVGSESVWVQPVSLAARWSSPAMVQLLLDRYEASPFALVPHTMQNLLAVLCAQPPTSLEMVGALQGRCHPDYLTFQRRHLFPADLAQNHHAVAGDFSDDQLHSKYLELLELRNKEMVCVAELLLTRGVDPLQPDSFGRNAVDYASQFGHKAICSAIIQFSSLGSCPLQLAAAEPEPAASFWDEASCRTPEPRNRRPCLVVLDGKQIIEARTPEKPECAKERNEEALDFVSPSCDSQNSMKLDWSCSSSLPTGFGVIASSSCQKKRKARKAPAGTGRHESKGDTKKKSDTNSLMPHFACSVENI